VTIEAIHHVNIRAPAMEIEKLRQFYCEIVGLREGWRPPFESRGFWLYAGDRAIVHLVEGGAEVDVNAARGCVDHVAFRCSDLAPMISRLQGRGIAFRLSRVPTADRTPGDQQLLFRDPLGIGVELTAGVDPC
jgi:catechol 2,3-dioxygenase-like lactoylglutathione lyase family enzyme